MFLIDYFFNHLNVNRQKYIFLKILNVSILIQFLYLFIIL